MRKTIFITLYDGDTEKNILRTGVFETLKLSNNHLVLLVRGSARLSYYQKEFGGEAVSIELLPPAFTFTEQVWYFMGWNTLPTHSSFLRRRINLARKKNYFHYILGAILWKLGHIRLWREFLRFLYKNTPDTYAGDLFDKYKPDLLFSPNMFSPEDSRLLRAAKKRGIKTVVTAKSWDVLTTKAFTRVKADRIIVFNQFNKEEAISIGDYRPDQIVIAGFPQFDAYAREETFISREAFIKQMGLDLNKRLVLFAVPGDWKTPFTKDIFLQLDERIEAGRFIKPLHILARLHPKYIDSSEKLEFKHITFDRPGTLLSGEKQFSVDMGVANTFDWTFTDKDISHLANSIRHSECVINTESTLTLDAAANNKPVVLIGYDGDAHPSYWNSVARIYERDHYRHVLETEAAPLVRSHDELESVLNAILENPEYRKSEREKLKETLLLSVDGRSGQRVAEAVLGLL